MQNIKIVVADRGWIFVGRVWKGENSIKIENANIIRRWGTTEGLGELAIKGPLEETKLDKCLDVEIPNESVKAIFNCNQSKWNI